MLVQPMGVLRVGVSRGEGTRTLWGITEAGRKGQSFGRWRGAEGQRLKTFLHGAMPLLAGAETSGQDRAGQGRAGQAAYVAVLGEALRASYGNVSIVIAAAFLGGHVPLLSKHDYASRINKWFALGD